MTSANPEKSELLQPLDVKSADPLHGTFAVGSESHVQIADPRMKSLASR
jgi:hypothetical protein